MSKLNIKVVDMEAPQIEAAKKVNHLNFITFNQCINEAFDNYREERHIANKIKEVFDKDYGNLYPILFHKSL